VAFSFTKKNNDPAGRNKSIKVGKFSDILVFALVVVAAIFVMSVVFRIGSIDVVGNTHYTDGEIISAIDIEKGDNLFFFDRFAAISRVFAKLPYVEEVSVERTLPGKVTITVRECKAMAYITIGDENWTLDHTCKVLGKATETELEALIPVLGVDPGTLFIGETLTTSDDDEAAVEYLAAVLYQIQARNLTSRVSKIDFSDKNHVSLTYDTRFTVNLGDAALTEMKFGLFLSAVAQLLVGDAGLLDVSNGESVHFTPN